LSFMRGCPKERQSKRTDLKTMFAVVRTGGKQYRVAAGDKIAVEKLAGDAGDTIVLGEVLLAGEGDKLAESGKITVSAEIIAQAKSEKVTVFKKRRRHNYRRKAGHRQQMTLLRIVSVGEGKPAAKKVAKAEDAPKAEAKAHETERQEPAKGVDVVKETKAKKAEPVKKAATAKAADDKPAAAKKPAAKKAPVKKPVAKK
jgi:large subunit ribosomal protein L21